jgi:hypothetical protein
VNVPIDLPVQQSVKVEQVCRGRSGLPWIGGTVLPAGAAPDDPI